MPVAAIVYDLVCLSWVVTVTFQNIAACKLLFFVKNKGQWNVKKRSKGRGWGKLLCEKNLRDVWCRNEIVRAEIGQIVHTHTHTHASPIVSIDD